VIRLPMIFAKMRTGATKGLEAQGPKLTSEQMLNFLLSQPVPKGKIRGYFWRKKIDAAWSAALDAHQINLSKRPFQGPVRETWIPDRDLATRWGRGTN
jgi:hypothetical protein